VAGDLRGRQKFVMLILPQRASTALPFQPRRSHRWGWIILIVNLHQKFTLQIRFEVAEF